LRPRRVAPQRLSTGTALLTLIEVGDEQLAQLECALYIVLGIADLLEYHDPRDAQRASIAEQ
jgi:hypothetical protein